MDSKLLRGIAELQINKEEHCMKKTLCLLLALSLVIAALVPAMAEGNVFTGTARGMQGDVVVNVTIEDGKI